MQEQFRKPYGKKPTYNKKPYNKPYKTIPNFSKNPVSALHATMRCLSAVGKPMYDAKQRAKDLLAILEQTKDAPQDVIAGIKDTLSVFEDLFYNYSVIYGNLHLAGHSLFKNKVTSMEEQYEGDEGHEEEV